MLCVQNFKCLQNSVHTFPLHQSAMTHNHGGIIRNSMNLPKLRTLGRRWLKALRIHSVVENRSPFSGIAVVGYEIVFDSLAHNKRVIRQSAAKPLSHNLFEPMQSNSWQESVVKFSFFLRVWREYRSSPI